MSRPWTGISGEEAERREQDIRNRIPPEPEEFVLVAQPDGILKANYCMWHVVNRRMREKRMRGSNGMDAKHSLLDSNHKQRNVAWRCPSG
jgi:hypothetical protein